MSYRVRKKKEKYIIFEKESGNSIVLNMEEKDIRSICRKLNLGSGFNGWTPGFFATWEVSKSYK